MKIINASAHIDRGGRTFEEMRRGILQRIERAARTCYKSEDAICEGSDEVLTRNLVKREHFAMLEHATVSVRFVVDIGVAREITRHRVASFAQESTRYCNYSGQRFGSQITVIRPCFLPDEESPEYRTWLLACTTAELAYFRMLELTGRSEQARDVLPISTKTELYMTANMREWKHFFDLRADGTTGAPHPQMLEVAVPLKKEFQKLCPEIFDEPET